MASFDQAVKEQSRVILCNLLGGPDSVPYLGGTPNPDINQLQKRINGARRYVCNDSNDITEQEIQDTFPGGESFDGVDLSPYGGALVQHRGNLAGTLFVRSCLEFEIRQEDPFLFGDRVFGFWVRDCNGTWYRSAFIENTSTGDPNQYNWRGTIQIIETDVCFTTGVPLPEPPRPPYIPTPITVNIEYEDNSQTIINEDVDITIFAPIAVVAGNIIAPITVSGNTFQLAGTVEISPNFEVKLSPEFNINRAGNTDENPPEGVDQPSLPEPENERRVIVGAIVTATGIGATRSDSIPQGGNPDIWIPRLGSISFYVATDKGTAWTSDIDIKNTRCYIPCPVPSGAVDVAATGVSGISLDVEAVWAYPLQAPI